MLNGLGKDDEGPSRSNTSPPSASLKSGEKTNAGEGLADAAVRKKESHSAVPSFFAGLVASAILHPFDLIKTRMQVSTSSGGAIPLYKGSWDACKAITAKEGVAGLYKGLSATVLASGVSWGLFRFLFDHVRYAVDEFGRTGGKAEGAHISFNANLVAGLIAGGLCTCVVHPLWLLKSRMEMQSFESKAAGWIQYRGPIDCLSKIVRTEGPLALYKGIGPALCLVPHAAIQMIVYEEMKKAALPHPGERVHPVLPFVWGASSKLIAASVTYPFIVLRSQQQMQHSPFSGVRMSGIVRALVGRDGALALYRGFVVHVQRACINSGVLFLFFEGFSGKLTIAPGWGTYLSGVQRAVKGLWGSGKGKGDGSGGTDAGSSTGDAVKEPTGSAACQATSREIDQTFVKSSSVNLDFGLDSGLSKGFLHKLFLWTQETQTQSVSIH